MKWYKKAACAGLAPQFDITGTMNPPRNTTAHTQVKRVTAEKRQARSLVIFCDVCPVRRECLADAVEAEIGGFKPSFNSVYRNTRSIRGGLTAGERAMHYVPLVKDKNHVWRGLRDAAREWLQDHADTLLVELLQEKK